MAKLPLAKLERHLYDALVGAAFGSAPHGPYRGHNIPRPGYRWGSCGRSGALYFNWKLVQMPPRVIDYVIAHVLAHLSVPDHGPAFWNVLERSLPDWRERAEEMKGKATAVYWCYNRMP